MAKKRSEDARPSKMTVMIFQLEGDDSTLQEGFKTISAAMSRVLPSAVQMLPSASKAVSLAALPADADEDDEEVLDIEAAPVARVASSSRRRVKSPAILDLDLTSGDPPLKEFLSTHSVDEGTKRYLLIAYWLKTYGQVIEVSPDHIHTCFRVMGWQTPRDAAQPLRDMKSRLGWFHKGAEKGHYAINHVGENEVIKIIQGNS